MDQRIDATDYLWENLLINKGFYAYTFQRDIDISGVKTDFFCDELRLAILLRDDIDKHRRLKDDGCKVIYIDPSEILTDFKGVTDYLTDTLKDIVGQPCGGW